MNLKVVAGNSESLAPAHLKPKTRAWFDEIVASFELESHHIRVLQIAAESWDLYETSREQIEKNGLTFRNEKVGDIKMRPEVSVMRDSRLAFLRSLRELNLDIQPPDAPRPNPLKYPR